MSNFDVFKDTVMQYFKEYGISVSCLSNLHKDSLNEAGDRYLYNGELDFKTISMDTVAKDGYKQVKGTLPEEHPINTVDSSANFTGLLTSKMLLLFPFSIMV